MPATRQGSRITPGRRTAAASGCRRGRATSCGRGPASAGWNTCPPTSRWAPVADDADFRRGMLPPGQDPLHTDPPSGGIDYGTGALDTKSLPERGILGRAWDSTVSLPTGVVRRFEGREPDTGAPRFSFPDVPNISNATGGFDALER